MTTTHTDTDTGLDQLDPATRPSRDASHFRRIIAARQATEAAEQELRDAVRAARDAGDSWAVIGAALGVSKQTAFNRHNRPDPSTSAPPESTRGQLSSIDESSTLYSGSTRIGTIGQIYLNDETGEPVWATVKTGLFGSAETFLPLQAARVDGNNVQVDYDEETIKGAPRVNAAGSLSPAEEDELYRYYGLTGPSSVDE